MCNGALEQCLGALLFQRSISARSDPSRAQPAQDHRPRPAINSKSREIAGRSPPQRIPSQRARRRNNNRARLSPKGPSPSRPLGSRNGIPGTPRPESSPSRRVPLPRLASRNSKTILAAWCAHAFSALCRLSVRGKEDGWEAEGRVARYTHGNLGERASESHLSPGSKLKGAQGGGFFWRGFGRVSLGVVRVCGIVIRILMRKFGRP